MVRAIELFPFKEYIEENFPDYKYVGTSKDILRINCFMCSDHRYRLYVQTQEKVYWCHNCSQGRSKGLIDFLMDYEGKSRSQVISDLLRLVRPTDSELERAIRNLDKDAYEEDHPDDAYPKPVNLPPYVHRLWTRVSVKGPIKNRVKKLHKQAKDYLKGRLVKGPLAYRHHIHVCYAGRFRNRIIFPAFMNGQQVSWVARKLRDGGPGGKYLNASDVDQGTILWNFDGARIYDEVVVCEGVMDGLRIGDDAVAAFGKNVTAHHLKLIEDNWNKAVLLLDPDALSKVYSIAKDMIIPVRIALLPIGTDAGDTDYEVLRRLIRKAPLLNTMDDYGQHVEALLADVT